MATAVSQLQPIVVMPGVQPGTDQTPLSTPYYTMSDKIRSWRGVVQKIGGWVKFAFQYGATIQGVARTLYSAVIGNVSTSLIGTNTDLYALYGQQLTNITPFDTVTHAIANSISTDFATLGSNPISTTIGSGNITVTDTNASLYQLNDGYTLSGATTTNGVPNTQLNTQHVIRALGVNTVTFIVATVATSSGSGGGASVVRSTGRLRFAATAHGQANGDRVKITGAAATGGITALQINAEFIVRNVATNTFDVMTAGTATSAVTASGGAGTVYQKQIIAGNADQSFGLGYGLGLYGAGLYGTSKMSITGVTYPRIWFVDRFADRVVATPGNQGAIYLWDGSTTVAPPLLTNAPTDVNYLFVSDNIVVTFGHQNVANQIFSSDQGDATVWTASSQNQVFQDVVAGADRLISSVPVLGINLIFTPSQTYTFSYIGLPNVWAIKLLDNSVGIIAPLARCSVNGVAYWMAHNNFYMYSGGNVTQIPSAPTSRQQGVAQDSCSFLNYVFKNINQGQISKAFAWYNDLYNEVWFHYPSSTSNECDRIARLSIADQIWWPDTMDRTCAEYPDNLFIQPRLISFENNFYIHETGFNADTAPLPFTLTSNLIASGKGTVLTTGFVPDSIQTGNIQVRVTGQLWPQSTDLAYDKTFTIAANGTGNEPSENIQIAGRFRQYTWSGSDLDQQFIMGVWGELVQPSAQR